MGTSESEIMLDRVLSFFLLICCLSAVSGLYFHIGETERKCFIEEIPDETMVVGNYKVEMFDKMQNKYVPTVSGLGMHVEVRDPDDKVIMSRTYAAEGRFTFTSHTAGEHIICLHSNSSAWFGGGQLRVRQLLDQVEQITKEQNYQRYREERFRQTSESTNQRVLWWSLGQTCILVVMGAWQMRHLKSFFEAKKLV